MKVYVDLLLLMLTDLGYVFTDTPFKQVNSEEFHETLFRSFKDDTVHINNCRELFENIAAYFAAHGIFITRLESHRSHFKLLFEDPKQEMLFRLKYAQHLASCTYYLN